LPGCNKYNWRFDPSPAQKFICQTERLIDHLVFCIGRE
jgi:hypothetical protein